MLRTLLLAVIFVAAIAFAGYGQVEVGRAPNRAPTVAAIPANAEGLPHDVPPEHAVASVGDGQLLLLRFSFALQQRKVVAKIEVDGEVSEESITRTVPVGSVGSVWIDLSEIRAFENSGELAPGQLTKRLAKPTHVLVATKRPDPFYMDVIKDGTIVLVMPSLQTVVQMRARARAAAGIPGMPAPPVEEQEQLVPYQ